MYSLGNLTRVNLAADGTVNAVYGDAGYAADGSNGRVMVRIPKCWVYASRPATNTYRWWISDVELDGFEVHPAFVQRDNVGAAVDYIYVGAYEASLDPLIAGHKLHSRSGKQPMTGGVIFEVPFDAGTNEPDVGDTVTTVGGDDWLVVGYELSAGAWDGSGVGKLWISKVGDDDPGWVNDEVITNTTQAGETVATQDGADAAITFDIDDAEDFANNIGTGWGITNIWTRQLILMLMMQDWCNLDSQTELGRGVVDLASGTGFAGALTGADNVDSNLNAALTGAGDNGLAGEAADGDVPVTWRGIENFWGNVWEFVIGYNAVDAEYRIIKEAGVAAATMAGTLAGGTYDASAAAPITSDGYISNVVWEDLLKYLFIPSAVAGASSTYIPDYLYAHDAGETNILLAGGVWYSGADAGAACLHSSNVASFSYRYVGARLEFIP